MSIADKTKDLKYKVPMMFYVVLLILIIIAIWIIGSLSGFIPIKDILLNFIGFISMLVSITMLAIVGAIFLGMYLSHRILTKKGFTPFEISMLEMHEDIKDVKKRLSKIENQINNDMKTNGGNKK
jgi:amino acid permease